MIKIREVNIDDTDLIFEWSNDPLVRAASFSSEKISIEDHKRWMQSHMDSDSSFLFIATLRGLEIGLVRFTEDNENWLIGVNLNPNERGKRLSSKLIVAGLNRIIRVSNLPVLAYIKTGNEPSIKAFESAGFIFDSETELKGAKCYLYVWKSEDLI